MNIISTIPKSKYRSWAECEAVLRQCDGEDDFWLVNTMNLPKKAGIGDLCYMVYDGMIRGYFHIVDIQPTESFRSTHRIGKRRITDSLQLVNWFSITPIPKVGFQGWNYTALRP
ncbi:MAG TPA: hypothetical protein VGB67_04115 [Fibrella sp.]